MEKCATTARATAEVSRPGCQPRPKIRLGSPAATPTSFEADLLQKIVDIGQVHQNLARLRALIAADDPVLGKLVDDAAGPRVSDIELSLHERHRRTAFRRHRPGSAREQWVQLPLRGLVASLPLRARALLEDLVHVSRLTLRTPEVHHRLDLGVAHERALDAGRLARGDGLVEHVSAAKKLFGAP